MKKFTGGNLINSTPPEERRVNPQVYSSVNRDLDRLFTSHLGDLLRTMETPWTPDPRGNPHPPQSVIGALILKIYYSASYDEIEARLKGMKELFCKTFGVERIPTHSVIHRGMKNTSTKFLRNLLEKTIQKVKEDRRTAIDSSGFTTKESSKWYDIRIGKENQKKDYLKLHLLVDVDSGQLLDVRMTRSKKHDSPVGKAMLKKIGESPPSQETKHTSVEKPARSPPLRTPNHAHSTVWHRLQKVGELAKNMKVRRK